MASRPHRPAIPPRFIEFALMIAVIASLISIVQFWLYRGYLPAPFVFDVGDTFMDWFNTAYYAHNPGAYDVWRTVYAPLSFIFLKVFGDGGCYGSSPFDARDCDVIGSATIVASYVACCVAGGIAFYKTDRSTAQFRTVAFTFSLPLLYGLERGNLILVSFVFFILMFGNVVRSRSAIAVCAAMIINFKSYLLFPMVAYAIKREWRVLEICGIATVALYLLTLALMGSGTPWEIQENLTIFFRLINNGVWDQVYYSTSYQPLLLFDERQYPVRDYIPQFYVDWINTLLPILIGSARGAAILCLGASWLQPNALSKHRVALLMLLQSFIGASPGGYGQIFLVFLIFLEPWKNGATGLAIVCAYLLSLPFDYTIGNFYTYEKVAWLSQRTTWSAFGLSIGALIRPGVIIVALWALVFDSARDLMREFRRNPIRVGLGRDAGLMSSPLAAARLA